MIIGEILKQSKTISEIGICIKQWTIYENNN